MLKVGDQVVLGLVGRPPKRCSTRNGVVTQVQDQFLVVQTAGIVRPVALEHGTSSRDLQWCLHCRYVRLRSVTDSGCSCGSRQWVTINPSPTKYYVVRKMEEEP